ncbi:DUF500-domain-containing protein [Westerdykella ornata]|uniref:DUF500-domain-containing protein n=1 Tax=Westerdykella ornata TaxID=318751 RepID=A0A6A6JNZ0_WESOR|nr:DUF500-domain-containing protein [Westerdykella ornata]KAF2277863.1 DUF500-domain-containing protein [Westerdykella ornata]
MVHKQGIWAKTKTGSKAGFDKLYGWVDKLGPPINRLSNKVGAEAFWPTTLDKESDKAARILRSFCKDGFYVEEETPNTDGPKSKQKVVKKIPPEVIKNAKGLAVFTVMRTGLWVSGAGGSGILIGRKEDGTWSPPSGIMLHTAGLGFLAGVDIYDCVVVINTQKALEAFSKIRCTLGGEISAVAGPVGVGGMLETELHKRQAPIFTYLKSRGLYAGVQVDGTIIIERTDENERFYGERIGVKEILAGKVRHAPYETRRLLETLRAAQGDTDFDQSLLPDEAPPADFEVESEKKVFGVPNSEDPDPFGVLALEQAGLEIREAGTRRRPTSEQFEFKPSPTSPIYTTFRHSMDRSTMEARSRRSSWRTSAMSSIAESRQSIMVDSETQTDLETPSSPQENSNLPPTPGPPSSSGMRDIPEEKSIDDARRASASQTDDIKDEPHPKISVETAAEEEEERALTSEKGYEDDNNKATSVDDMKDISTFNSNSSSGFVDEHLDDDADDDVELVEPVTYLQASAPQMVTRARIVTVPKPVPPKLPPRSPLRKRHSDNSNFSSEGNTPGESRDMACGPSPDHPGSPPTPSLRNDASSGYSSHESVSSMEALGPTDHQPVAKGKLNALQKQEDNAFISAPSSPPRQVPGSFH